MVAITRKRRKLIPKLKFGEIRRILLFLLAAAIATIFNFIPALFPFLAPCEWFTAYCAVLAR
jgi:hypothetical protein